MQNDNNVVLVQVTDQEGTRNNALKSVQVDALANNVNVFITQIQSILDKTPTEVGQFKFTEFTVSAEISAKGALIIMGSGIETEGKGGLTFKFERK